MLIEDNPADVLLIELALKENGIICTNSRGLRTERKPCEVLCGPEAPDSLVPDAILLDLNTPRSDGFQVLIKFKKSPRLMRSAYRHHHLVARDQRQAPL